MQPRGKCAHHLEIPCSQPGRKPVPHTLLSPLAKVLFVFHLFLSVDEAFVPRSLLVFQSNKSQLLALFPCQGFIGHLQSTYLESSKHTLHGFHGLPQLPEVLARITNTIFQGKKLYFDNMRGLVHGQRRVQGENSNTVHMAPAPGWDYKAHCLLQSLFELQDLLIFPGLALSDSTYPASKPWIWQQMNPASARCGGRCARLCSQNLLP